MDQKLCPSCSEGILIPKYKQVLFTYQGGQYQIPDVVVQVCNTCGEEVINATEIRRMEKIAKQTRRGNITTPPHTHPVVGLNHR